MVTFKYIFYNAVFIVFNMSLFLTEECSPSKKSCEFWLHVEERLTMTFQNIRVVANNGRLYKYNNNSTEVSMDEVITTDGIPRSVICVNNTIPGPPLVVYEGQELIIHVKNRLLSEAITVHWHGLHQKETPFMDGVAFISQCPIGPGQAFTYRFKASPKGTFWYHSHIGGQRVDGFYGALIIKDRNEDKKIQDLIMHVSDWFHSTGSNLHAKMIYGNFKSQPEFIHPKTLDGVFFAPVIFKSALFEGRGRYKDINKGIDSGAPYKEYIVESNKQYRFRVIGSGMVYPFRISIDHHLLTVVSTDGYDTEPRVFESIIINPGERYDFIITANQFIGDYWIRAAGMEVDFADHDGLAILRYNKSSNTEPNTTRKSCSSDDPCLVLNCQFSNYPKNMNTKCVLVDELNAKSQEEVPLFGSESQEHFLNFVQGNGRMVINGNIFEHPAVSSLSQDADISPNIDCRRPECQGEDAECWCHHELDIPFDQTIQMIWTNHGVGATRHHPIHLHGHSFHVLKIGYANYNETTGKLLSLNEDIFCGNTSRNRCNNPTWRNSSWKNGNVPGLKIKNAIQKDTLMIPVGGYAVIRFRSNNPGKWFLHCHVEFHSMQGMAMIVNEAQERHPSLPKGFPVCQNFHSNPAIDTQYVKEVAFTQKKEQDELKETFLILFIVFLAFLVIENCVLFLCCCVFKKKEKKKTEIEKVEDRNAKYKKNEESTI